MSEIFSTRAALALLLALPLALLGQTTARADQPPEWTTPIAPFRIAGNLYYVGSQDLASYLVVTPAGNILINSDLESSLPLLEHSVEALGFKFKDTKILLISHAHFDHDAGSAAVIHRTGAQYMVMDGDVGVVQSGGKTDFAYPDSPYPAAKVDRVLHDGDEVRLGGSTLVAHKTPGHTRGCTTWTMVVKEGARPLNVVIVGSWYVNPGFRLVDTPTQKASYPGIATDYQHTFQVLAGLPCDIFLGAHGAYFDMLGKLERQKTSAATPGAFTPSAGAANVWIDPTGYHAALAERQQAFQIELARQQQASRAGGS